MRKTSIICLILLMVLSLWATSIPQKKIKISPEQKFKLWLNDTIKHIKGKYTISSDSTLLTITDSFSYIVRKGKIAYSTNKKNSEAIQYMLKDVHEPPYINYRVIANRYDEFTPSEIDQLKYEAYTEFPLIKVLAKNVIINYNEIELASRAPI